MDKNLIKRIQKQILSLLPSSQRSRPGILLADSCSEVSRLVAGWIKRLDKSSRIFILKGVNVCGAKKAHDILAIIADDNHVYIIDPTVWQFFPRAKLILIFISDNLDTVLDKIKIKYGGRWVKSEEFTKMNKKEEKGYLRIIVQNIRENSK